MKKSLVILLLLLVCTGCNNNSLPTPTPTATPSSKPNLCDPIDPCENKANMTSYATMADIAEHVYIEITMEQALAKIESNESEIIYFGFDTCPWCLEVVPVLNEVAQEEGLSVYYVNTRSDLSISEEGMAYRAQIVEILQDLLQFNEDRQQKWLYVPDVLFMKNGEIMANHIGTLDDHDATQRQMTEEEEAQLKQIFQDYFVEYKK